MILFATRLWLRDAAERVIATYLQAFIGLLLAAATPVTNMGTLRAAAIAAIPAGLAVIKAIIGKQVPGTVSPASVT